MTLSLLTLVYGIGFYLVASYILVNTALARRLCLLSQTPDREVLVAVVAGILWPVLAASYVGGLLWYGITLVRGHRAWA